jgi:hypothetical protein
MGQGLSELQKAILKIAYRNRVRKYGESSIRNSEVLIGHYRFPHHPPSVYYTSGTPNRFRPAEIGLNRYRSASVSVVKSFQRLIKRGLATREYFSGITLTELGNETARALTRGSQRRIK